MTHLHTLFNMQEDPKILKVQLATKQKQAAFMWPICGWYLIKGVSYRDCLLINGKLVIVLWLN